MKTEQLDSITCAKCLDGLLILNSMMSKLNPEKINGLTYECRECGAKIQIKYEVGEHENS